ncbi:hypothetical protein DIGNKC_258 [Bacillus phage DIGNKC]|uniref:hypothetical protein n=1 Tax=Bacillus phage DIGNKC TaxID=1805948 RepID=UPI0007A76E79|nr:hypothetical protein BI007_gp116 [Bacillus phage DIGNKC]AMW62779.1 hypothetical protein DIGNKC_258 [Bacillus phage DIGNKC]AOZ61885.1 hypothetical protein BJ4_262 [Bacillus phage BJ4]AOZ62514.1 hypothetical protein SBP8a_264 [Bacillus phage SBP8a]UGO46510.1 hypothetical protein ABINADI_193 [Bacillus phage vB_BanH_Abinadi]
MTLSTSRKPLHRLNEVVHELVHYGYFDVNSWNELSSVQIRDILDILGMQYTTENRLMHDMYPYTRIKLK